MTITLVPRATAPADPIPTTSPARFLGAAAFLSHYLARRRWRFAVLALCVALAAASAVAAQYGMKLLVDALAGPRQGAAVGLAVSVFLAFVAAETVLWRVAGWLGCRLTVATGVDIRSDVFDHLTGHAFGYFQSARAGALGHRVTALAGNFGALCNRLVWDVTPPVIGFLGALVIFAALDPTLALGVGAATVASTSSMILLGLRGAPLHRAHAAQSSRVGGELIDVLANIWPVKAFSARERERARLAAGFEAEARAHRRGWLFNEKLRILNDAALLATAALTLVWTLHLWRTGSVGAGDVVVVATLTFRLLHGSRDLAMALIAIGQNYAYVDETLALVGVSHAIADAPDARTLIRRGGALRIEDLHFAYADRRPAIRGLSLEVPAGQKLGLVGPSGAGKSTVLSLVQRLHDPQSGRILLDGQLITLLRQDDLRGALAVVPQEVTLFHRSIADNIRFGRPDATDAEVRQAARAAFCDAFIDALPQGYHSLVGERGSKLSGGQRQRLGVARALLKDAPIVLLDEATSALDTQSEIEVQRALDRLMQGRTVIAVAHRLSTLTSFDRIVVMQDGAVVEDGAPLELRARRGVFDRMWRQQAGMEDAPPARWTARR